MRGKVKMMKRMKICLFLALVACTAEPAPRVATTTSVFGTVSSEGLGLEGVRVLGAGGVATTDPEGRFVVLANPGTSVLRFEKVGHVTAFHRAEVFEGQETALHLTLPVMAPARRVDAEEGGQVENLVVPAGSLLKGTTLEAVEGSVDVHLTSIDVHDHEGWATRELFAAGGVFEPTYMLDITLLQEGEPVRLAPLDALELRVPVEASEAAESLELWSFDEVAGVWRAEGAAELDAEGGFYRAEISHLSLWAVGARRDATCLTGTVSDAEGAPLVGARVIATGVDYWGSSTATVGADGRFHLAVRQASRVSVLAQHAEGGGEARTLQSGEADTAIPPVAGDARCLDVGEWSVERGVAESSDEQVSLCEALPAKLLEDTCAAPFMEAIHCFGHAGECVWFAQLGGFTVRWANGAEADFVYEGQQMRGRYRGGDGRHCYDLEYSADPEQAAVFTSTLPDGRRYRMKQDDRGLPIECPGGAETRLELTDLEAWQACGEVAGPQTCFEVEAPANRVQRACGPGEDCGMGEVCCRIPVDAEWGVCVDPAICEQA